VATIDELLAGLELRVEPLAVCEVRAGRSLDVPPQDAATVHYVLQGRGELRFPGGGTAAFEPDSVVIAPPRAAQRIIAAPDGGQAPTRCVGPALGLTWLKAGEGGAQALLACGRIRARAGVAATPFDGLPAPLVEPPAHAEDGLRTTFRALLEELAAPRLGGRAMAQALMTQWLVLLLRRLTARGGERLPWLQAARDPQLAPAVAAMLARPEQDSGLDDLAALAGMSRSTFVARFREIFGQPPHAFLTACRLDRAARLLTTTDLPVKTVAGRVGYRSRSHFTRAFKARFGRDPAAWRQGGAETERAASAS